MNLGMILVMLTVALHTIGTMINNEEIGKMIRNAAFSFYGIIFLLMIGGII